MSDNLSGDIVIEDDAVKFSDKVGKYATPEQVTVLYRTAERLKRIAIVDRYPEDPLSARVLETVHSSRLFPPARNEYGVPIQSITNSIMSQMKELGK